MLFFEDFSSMKPRFFDDSHHGIFHTVPIDVAYLKLVNGIGQLPTVAGRVGLQNQPAQRIVDCFHSERLCLQVQAAEQTHTNVDHHLHTAKEGKMPIFA